MRFSVLLGVAALQVGSVFAHVESRADREFLCGTRPPPPALIAEAAAQSKNEGSTSRYAFNLITVNTYVHVVTTAETKGNFTQKMVNDQIDVMNKHYGPKSIGFKLISTDFTVNDTWATAQEELEETGLDMKRALRKGTYQDLNLYFLSDLGGGLLGFCYFPTDVVKGSPEFIQDGCINLASSLPGGGQKNYDLGGTASHEVGHWFGLFHVFQNEGTCDGPGDYVFDTPAQLNATRGCPEKAPDTCPSIRGKPIQGGSIQGPDSFHNYMDYSYDICYTEFTFGQQLRMFKMWAKYRFGK